MKRIRGLKSLVQSAVEHGSRAVEKVQIEMAKTPFDILEQVPPLKVPAAGVRLIYNTSVSTTHGVIRLVNKVVGDTLDVVIDTVAETAKENKEAKEAESAKAAGAPEAEPMKSEKAEPPPDSKHASA